ncbi:HlyD family type I secretion periplasmic adaptor subunit [Temperatibacter marinus]|uniref:Membrane fusion protein (MFP) family protein n=1 Tax=Temperatibacter marinus TaxID=1456591 RepID=A0AA52EEA0_9PROT|nr:HlyD family type I secretion periplasmic adaptor subunit [Temperatibacter marinus]WND03196.1 HlyD family type I secretion periplasmic adaptor subunit [Temperatibacter marinus]
MEEKQNDTLSDAPQKDDLTASVLDRRSLGRWHSGLKLDYKPDTKTAKLVGLLVFGFGGFWAAFAPLESAITAQGRVIADLNNRVIQHLEGGILQEVAVNEGERVDKGDIVAVMDTTRSRVQQQSLLIQRAIRKIQLSRRRAEVLDKPAFEIPKDIQPETLSNASVKEALQSQREEFDAVMSLISSRLNTIDREIDTKNAVILGNEEVKKAYELQLELTNKEVTDYRELNKKGLIQRTRLFQAERNKASLQARIETTKLTIGKTINEIKTLEVKKGEVKLSRLAVAEKEAIELQKQLNDIDTKLESLDDLLSRTFVKSPVDGVVIQISTHTVGAVIKPGEPIMSIFPVSDSLKLDIKIPVNKIDEVHIGQEFDIIFATDSGRGALPVLGTLTFISRDSITSDQDPEGYYRGFGIIKKGESLEHLLPGNTGTVYIKGQPTTLLSYILRPLTQIARGSLAS